MTHPKILPTHLQRKAVVYVRQSTPHQVEQNLESRDCQYQLLERAQRLGWAAADCEIIDDDLGISGAHAHNRPGYQRLIAAVAMRDVGIVLSSDVSRLARNNRDWSALLELAGGFAVLIADEDSVFDPRDLNDRMLLGLKGTLSEFEWHQLRMRMTRGQINKAKRGEFVMLLPIGLVYDRQSQSIQLDPDEQIQAAIALIFMRFRQVRSIRAVLRSFQREQRELPAQHFFRGGRTITWRAPDYHTLNNILTNPTYAGIYCYGRRQTEHDPLNQTQHIRTKPRAEWTVFIPDHHLGYLTLDEFEENQRLLAENRKQYLQRKAAPQQGAALLQGIIICGHCGRRMSSKYTAHGPRYVCEREHIRWGKPRCNTMAARRVDELVEELFLRVVNHDTLQASLDYQRQFHAHLAEAERHWHEKLQRLEQEAELARRRYEAVDPTNRLVAQRLETSWNERLQTLEQARCDYASQYAPHQHSTSTPEVLQAMITHLRAHWNGGTLSYQDKKELLRCLVDEVQLDKRSTRLRVVVRWQGGATTELAVPMYLQGSAAVYHRVCDLTCTHTDSEIAALLNQEGQTTHTGKAWTTERVAGFRTDHAIPSAFTTVEALRLRESGYVTTAEAAAHVDVQPQEVLTWLRWGVVCGKQAEKYGPVWILWNDELRERLSGAAPLDSRMLPVRNLCRERQQTIQDVLAWAREQRCQIYRIRRGTGYRLYLMPSDDG